MALKAAVDGYDSECRTKAVAKPTALRLEMLVMVDAAGPSGLRVRGQGGPFQTLVRRGWLTCRLGNFGNFHFHLTPLGRKLMTPTAGEKTE